MRSKDNYIQLERSEAPLPLPKQDVTVRRYLDGSLHLFNMDKPLKFTELKTKPNKKVRIIKKAPTDHPWRRIKIGKSKYVNQADEKVFQLGETPVGIRPHSFTQVILYINYKYF